MTRPSHPRADELLADRALVGLDDAEARELGALGAADDESYDLAAAAVELATLPVEPMPAAIAERILAARHPRTLVGWVLPSQAVPSAEPPPLSPQAGPASPYPDVPLPHASQPSPYPGMTPSPMWPAGAPQPVPGLQGAPPPPQVIPRDRRRRRPAAAWLTAAATVVLVVGASAWWLLRDRAVPTVAQSRAELLASATDVTRTDWKPTPEAATAAGDVVWSRSAQRGFMRFTGLGPNDRSKTQYQLWIFDRRRDQAYPVDGGVFDVSSTGEVVIPITAKLHVDDASLFAVTIEQPGGVVVSKREHIVVTAAPS